MDDALKTKVIEYFNVESWLLFTHPLSKFLRPDSSRPTIYFQDANLDILVRTTFM